MRAPHVVSLRYHLVTDEIVNVFASPPPLEWETGDFRLRLEDGIATVQLTKHYSSVQEAREVVERHLVRWEAYAALQSGRLELEFDFEGAEWSSQPKGPALTVIGEPRLEVIVHRNPTPPPDHFSLSPDAETMWHRYEGYLNGREPLASMGYACLTWLEAMEGGRPKVAEKYNVDMKVLQVLGRLTSTVGEAQTARKFGASYNPRPHTGAEVTWVEGVIRALILRVGEYAADPDRPLTKLTMACLPHLPS